MYYVFGAVALSLVWFGLAALGAAMNFTQKLFDYPAITAQCYRDDVSLFWLEIIIGPIIFLMCVFDKEVRASIRTHGLWIPNASAKAKAAEIEDRANREMIERLFAKYNPPKEQEQIAQEVILLLKAYPDRDPVALLAALSQNQPPDHYKMH